VFNHNPTNLTIDDEDFMNEICDMQMLKEMGIQTWIGRTCLRHQEIATSRLEIPQIFMVELEE
jgi:hypothetical protein